MWHCSTFFSKLITFCQNVCLKEPKCGIFFDILTIWLYFVKIILWIFQHLIFSMMLLVKTTKKFEIFRHFSLNFENSSNLRYVSGLLFSKNSTFWWIFRKVTLPGSRSSYARSVRPSVLPFVRPSFRSSVRPSVRPSVCTRRNFAIFQKIIVFWRFFSKTIIFRQNVFLIKSKCDIFWHFSRNWSYFVKILFFKNRNVTFFDIFLKIDHISSKFFF